MPRIGIGVDVHPFAKGVPLSVAGLSWPEEEFGLAGHSDGDVVAHAMSSALLSAAGLGDLGSQVGLSDPRWKGAAGTTILAEVAGRVRAAGFEIGNVAVQMVGERPRLSARRDEAERTLADACGAPVSLSATTTEGMGLTGRGEGLAAIATALIVQS